MLSDLRDYGLVWQRKVWATPKLHILTVLIISRQRHGAFPRHVWRQHSHRRCPLCLQPPGLAVLGSPRVKGSSFWKQTIGYTHTQVRRCYESHEQISTGSADIVQITRYKQRCLICLSISNLDFQISWLARLHGTV
jgi:hypothetical protein